jgi:hypothetical protein
MVAVMHVTQITAFALFSPTYVIVLLYTDGYARVSCS